MNRFRCRTFMCVWVSMCHCLWWFFWACSTVCLCLFWSLLFNEVLCDFVCPCVHTVREKVWTGANPLGELGAHTHRAGPAHDNTLRPHRWLPPQQMTSAAEESSCLPIDTFNHRSLTEGPSFQNIWPTGNFWSTLCISKNIYIDICLTTFQLVTGQETQDKLFVMQI